MASSGQHVGGLRDNLDNGDDIGAAARAKARAMAALSKPVAQKRGPRYDIGDGDQCPLTPFHGRMTTLQGSRPPKQYCPHQSHDGTWAEGRRDKPTRAIWPLYNLAATVAEYTARREPVETLADIDITDLMEDIHA